MEQHQKVIRAEKRILRLIILIFVILGFVYAIKTPVFEASDELWHYPMIQHLADGNPLPVQVFDPDAAGPWKQEASQPPLYYFIGAALTFWIDSSDMADVRWLNPHVDSGTITSDGNGNLVIHDPGADPLRGTLLAVRIIRIFSVLLGASTVYLTYLIASEVFPGRSEITLGATTINAFTPMFIFISGAVNNDNLVIPLASLAILQMIRYVKRGADDGSSPMALLGLLGLIIGLGALTKITAIGLLLVALGVIVFERWRRFEFDLGWSSIRRISLQAFCRFLLVLFPVLLIAGWWYVRNLRLYGDWNGWSAFIAVLGSRGHAAGLAQLWGERQGFMMSYWGLFGGLSVPMERVVYQIFNGILVASVLGSFPFILLLLRDFRNRYRLQRDQTESPIIRIGKSIDRQFGLIVCLIWTAAVVIGLAQWATITWSSQGRLVFTAISALSTLLVIGLVGWLPKRPARIIVGAVGIFMLSVSAAAPFLWIAPAYKAEYASGIDDLHQTQVDFGGRIRLSGYDSDKTRLLPGDEIEIHLAWEVLRLMERDWSVFVHLIDPVLGVPIAQRDMYPGQGLLSTRLMQPGEMVINRYRIRIPSTAIAPTELSLTAGLYDFQTGERLSTQSDQDTYELTTISLESLPETVPNPLQINFGNNLELTGFSISERRLQQAETMELTLYWRPLKDLSIDYTFFAQVVDDDTTRWASMDLAQPTSSWSSGDTQSFTLSLRMDDHTPAGVYPIIVGVYTRDDQGGFDRLQMVTDDGRLTDDFLVLTQVRVD